MFSKLLKDVQNLSLPKGEYALFGSTPIIVRGLREASNDIDVLVTQRVWNEYSVLPEWHVRELESGEEYLEWLGHNIELYKSWGPGEWDIDKILDSAEEIDGVYCVTLDTVLEWKVRLGRPKDVRDIQLIKHYLRDDIS